MNLITLTLTEDEALKISAALNVSGSMIVALGDNADGVLSLAERVNEAIAEKSAA